MTALYTLAIIVKSEMWSDILSPLCAAAAGSLLLAAFIESAKTKRILLFLLLAISCFSWVFGDIVLAVLRQQGKGTESSLLMSVPYFIPNLLLGAGVLLFGRFRCNKWRAMKGLVETATIVVLCILFVWCVFFRRNDAAIRLLTSDGLISIVSILIDIFLCVEVPSLFFSEIRSKMPPHMYLFAAGIFLYSANDLVYYILVYKNLYAPYTFTDIVYIAAFALLAAGALCFTLAVGAGYSLREPRSDLTKSKWLYLLAFPVVTAAVGGAEAVDLLTCAVIIGLYHASVRFIQLAHENEALYQNQYSINIKLEKRLEEQLLEMTALANQDTVTKLYNRRYFSGCIQEAIRALKGREQLAVLQFDVDRFKTINDSYGHDVGDKVIVEISNRLLGWNTYGAVLARLGGDEFAVMLTGSQSREELSEYCRQLVETCSAPIFVGSQVLYITISIGISVCPGDAADSVTLLKNSDISMYKAKAEGYNKHVFYSPLFKENITRKNEIEALLRKADLESDFELVFQPQFSLPDERLIGAEALLRWKSAEHGYIPPSVFVPVAEEIDYITRIGKWVLNRAVDQIVEWNNKYGIHLKMGINISPKQLSEDDFFMTLKTLITSNGVNSAWIDAEITENLMIEEKSKVKPIFDLFEELNISVSIDDFGSGYSSLGYLTKYHFDRIKIDKSLIDNLMVPGDSGVEVVKAIITMAAAVGKTTIAEGVETREQLEILNRLGCRQVQGYLLGKPVPADVFAGRFIEKELEASGKKAGAQALKQNHARA
jgi:diguanylate cyclase (GGDEF)-like protein